MVVNLNIKPWLLAEIILDFEAILQHFRMERRGATD